MNVLSHAPSPARAAGTARRRPPLRSLASFQRLQPATEMADRLAREGAVDPVVVGVGLIAEERPVVDRPAGPPLAVWGALLGAVVGGLVAALPAAAGVDLAPEDAQALAILGVVLGAMAGLLLGLVARAVAGRGEPPTVPGMRARAYVVVAAEAPDGDTLPD